MVETKRSFDTVALPAKGAIGSIMRGPDEDAAARPVETPDRPERVAKRNTKAVEAVGRDKRQGSGQTKDDAVRLEDKAKPT